MDAIKTPPKKFSFAVIGSPVQHSLSPAMHRAALRAMSIPGDYLKIEVAPEHLGRFLRDQALKLDGFNVTIPHKETIIPYLDFVVPKARLMGAVNTVWRHQNRWIGFNTDGDGYLQSLIQRGFQPKGRHIVMLGAGGAARAIAYALLFSGIASLHIVNRNLSRADQLQRTLQKQFSKTAIHSHAMENRRWFKSLAKADLILNTTSVGLSNTGFIDFPWDSVDSTSWISDIVYRPRMTPFLREAKKHRLKIHTGEGMLIHQGALALELWTGKKAPIHAMALALENALKNDT